MGKKPDEEESEAVTGEEALRQGWSRDLVENAQTTPPTGIRRDDLNKKRPH